MVITQQIFVELNHNLNPLQTPCFFFYKSIVHIEIAIYLQSINMFKIEVDEAKTDSEITIS